MQFDLALFAMLQGSNKRTQYKNTKFLMKLITKKNIESQKCSITGSTFSEQEMSL